MKVKLRIDCALDCEQEPLWNTDSSTALNIAAAQSNFSLVLGSGGTRGEMGVQTYACLIESLRCASITCGSDRLPFDDVIN